MLAVDWPMPKSMVQAVDDQDSERIKQIQDELASMSRRDVLRLTYDNLVRFDHNYVTYSNDLCSYWKPRRRTLMS